MHDVRLILRCKTKKKSPVNLVEDLMYIHSLQNTSAANKEGQMKKVNPPFDFSASGSSIRGKNTLIPERATKWWCSFEMPPSHI
jgi:hypothetical protein